MVQISLWFAALFGLVAPIAGEPAMRGRSNLQAHEVKRAACTSDNVLRALQNAGATASSFCSSYIGIPVKTVYTHVPGVTPVMYNIFTSFHLLELAREFSSELLAYIHSRSTLTVPAIISATPNSAYYPNTLPTYISAYPTPSRISSGCSCLSVKQSTTTSTISSGTSTVVSTILI